MEMIRSYVGSTEGNIPKTKEFSHLQEVKEVGMHANGKETC